MRLKTHICKRTSDNNNVDYRLQNSATQRSSSGQKDAGNNGKTNISPLSCADWSSNEEIYFVSDDHQIYKWSAATRESVEVAKLPDDFIPTDLHWLLLGGRSSGGGKGSDTLLICSSDGRFIILNKSARVERNITAHSAAISTGRWSPDGAGLLTAGEDGVIKIWSRSGMLRSTVIQSDDPISCARWAPNSTSIVFSQGSYMSIKPLAANSKLTRWRAHDGLVLSLSWSTHSNIIASGGEDFRFKIWDSQGANLFTSSAEEYAITSVCFNSEKDVLLVGSFNMLKLCSSAGWSYICTRFSEPTVGSFYTMSWSSDGTQVACGTSTGNLVVGYTIDRQLISRNLKATTTGRKTILLQDITNSSSDVLDFPERIINFGLGYGHLIVATSNQLHIYNEKYINTPIIIDGRTDVRVIEVGKKFFMVLDATSIWVYTYNGRLHLNPRYPGMQAQIPLLTWRAVSLGLDVLAVRDNADNTVIHIFDLTPGASRQYEPHSLRAKTQISEISACRAGTLDDQYVVLIDNNRELYITETRNLNGGSGGGGGGGGGGFNAVAAVGSGTGGGGGGGSGNTDRSSSGRTSNCGEVYKIGTQVTTVMWASETNILVGVHDTCYSIWYCPGEGAADPTLIALTTVTVDATEFGKSITLETFEDAIVTFRCAGALLPVNVNIYCEILHRTLMEGQWQQALKICRLAQNGNLWATLAAIATRKNQLQISEEAYSAALQIDKVSYLQYIKELSPASPEQMAENSLMLGRLIEAETILLHNKKFTEAVALCLRMHNWHRALEVAQKHEPELLEKVLEQRRKYLKALQRDEWDAVFLPFKVKANDDKSE
ncbi:PREDICTED: intraflagellar transport protein 80 homolog [Rhagoletis zephyria]|uniref:intraflagellar transport protein 80 homolog n=1 Tax=Rhagoletis zephyria TaxID=28612 RepID=UPI0008115DAE|nr:PREDICTED: intraflagellar transport protein 80 homolog [Rhagoletis zephyria]